MKKLGILGVCALLGLGAMAQESVLKEAERSMKKGADYKEIVKAVTPAMSDPSTKDKAMTYYLPGKAAFNQFDQLLTKEALGQLDAAGKKTKAEALMAGYEYMMKALPLDSVVDAKGKVKTKYSKDILNSVGGHYSDFYSAGIDFWGAENYKSAYDAWDVYANLPSNPAFAKAIPQVPADTVIAEVMYNQALAAWQMNDYPLSLKAFLNAKDHGYQKKQLYDYAIAVAAQAKNDDAVFEIAKEAQTLYGDEDSNYMGYIINNYINKQQYQEAISMIDQAIAGDPQNAQYHVIKGILLETEEIKGDPKPEYQKAVDLDDHNAQALYNLGRIIYNEALQIYDAAPNDNEGFNKVFNNDFKPAMAKAIDLLERAYSANEEEDDPLRLLENAYYMMNDDANMKATQARLGK